MREEFELEDRFETLDFKLNRCAFLSRAFFSQFFLFVFLFVSRLQFFFLHWDIVVQHNNKFFLDVLHNQKSDKLEWIIIWLIACEIGLGLFSLYNNLEVHV